MTEPITAQAIETSPEALILVLPDRQVSIPREKCSPRLAAATETQRLQAELPSEGAHTSAPLQEREAKVAFEHTWADIGRHAGEVFYRLGGGKFTYEVLPDSLKVSDVGQPIPKGDLERACAEGRPATVTQLKQLGLANPSHVFGILTDPRIRV